MQDATSGLNDYRGTPKHKSASNPEGDEPRRPLSSTHQPLCLRHWLNPMLTTVVLGNHPGDGLDVLVNRKQEQANSYPKTGAIMGLSQSVLLRTHRRSGVPAAWLANQLSL
jgi:hypothetical protein